MHLPRPSGLLASLALLAALAPLARAEKLDLDRVAAEAVWLMHLDVDAMRDSTVVQRMYARMVEKHPKVEKMMGMGAMMMGIDVRKDLHDVTVYGLDTDKKNAVMIVHADVRREQLEKMVEKARDHETRENRGITIHSWTHKGWKGKGGPAAGAFYRDDVLVFARSADRVEMAIDVLAGKADAVDGDSPLAGRTRPGSIMVARASEVDPDTKCPVLRQGRGFRVAIGEHDGESFYRALLEMESEEAAELAEDVTEGLAAVIALGCKDEDVTELVDKLETMTSGETCLIAWDADADDVWEVSDRMAEKIEAKMAAKRKRWGGTKSGCGKDGCGDCEKDGCGDCEKNGCGGCEKGECEKGECPKHGKAEADDEEKESRRPFRDDEF